MAQTKKLWTLRASRGISLLVLMSVWGLVNIQLIKKIILKHFYISVSLYTVYDLYVVSPKAKFIQRS